MLAAAILAGTLAYIGIALSLAAVYHVLDWRRLSTALKLHGIWGKRFILPVQLTITAFEAVVGGAALWVLVVTDRASALGVLATSLVLAATLWLYIEMLRRSGKHVPCGCYFIAAPDTYDRPNHVPALGLLVACTAGISALLSTGANGDLNLGFVRVLPIAWLAASCVVLVQVLGVLKIGLPESQPLSHSPSGQPGR